MLNVFSIKKPVKKLDPTLTTQGYTNQLTNSSNKPKARTSSTYSFAAKPTVQKLDPTQTTQGYINKITGGAVTGQTPKVQGPTYSVPKPKPETEFQKTIPHPDASTNWLSYGTGAALKKQTLAEQQRKQNEDYIKQQYGLANQQLQEQLPAAQKQFGEFKANTEATIADLLAGGERQKGQARDYYGEAQRGAAQTRRETQGQTARTFANLNTLDSRGEGSFAQATENADSEFNRYTQQNLKAQADKLSEIDAAVGAAERSARATITQEETKINELARSIQYAMANNDLQQARELTAAFNQSQQYIYDIEDSVAQMKYQFGLEQQKLENEMARTSTANLSRQFKNTGKPATDADMEFIYNNPKGSAAYTAALASTNVNNSQQSAVKDTINLIDQVSTRDLTYNLGIAGALPKIPGTNAYGTSRLIQQIKDQLTLASRGQLKGQGQITEGEQKMLASAVTALDSGMSPADFKAEMNKVRGILERNGGVSIPQPGQQGSIITAPDGQQIIIVD